jgi:hypothetical protein
MRAKHLASSLIAIALAIFVAAPLSAQTKKEKKKDLEKTAKPVVWHDPGDVSSLDFTYGAGGKENVPAPPFTFIEEDLNGTTPKLKVQDSHGTKWTVKFGKEVNAETFAQRIAWAAGYFVQPAYFVPNGKIDAVDKSKLSRSKSYVGDDGSFSEARFEMRPDNIAKLKGDEGWGWNSNPFTGTKELKGLKIIMMLTSNWDNKDVRDAGRGSNTATYIVETPQGNEARYIVTDWGGSMGKWGGVFGRQKWDPDGYAKQSSSFLKASGNKVEFGYSGQHTGDFKNDITTDDIKWIAQYLGRISDDQLRAGLQASGASPNEIATFVPAIRERLDQLKRIQ